MDRPRRQDRGRRRRGRRDAPDDRHRVDARHGRDRRRREGRSAHAVQRRGSRRRQRTRRRRGGGSHRRHPSDGPRPAQRARRDRARRAWLDVLPGCGRLHGEGRDGTGGGRRDRYHGVAGRQRPSRRRGQGCAARGDHGDDPRPRATRGVDHRGPQGRGPRLPDHRRRRGGRHRRGDAAFRGRPAARDRRHARRRDRGGGAQVPGWRDPGTPLAQDRRRTEAPRSSRDSIWIASSRPTTSSPDARCSSRRPA